MDNLKINFEVKCPKISLKEEGVLCTQAIGFESPQIAEEKTKELYKEVVINKFYHIMKEEELKINILIYYIF